MALSKQAVKLAYKALQQFKKESFAELDIMSFPEDLKDFDGIPYIESVSRNTLYGFDKKSDGGWESLIFFVKNPTEGFQEEFKRIAKSVPNSSICKPCEEKPSLWKLGWF